MFVKYAYAVRQRVIAAFKTHLPAKCVYCNKWIQPGNYYTRIANEKVCGGCIPFKQVRAANDLRSANLLPKAPTPEEIRALKDINTLRKQAIYVSQNTPQKLIVNSNPRLDVLHEAPTMRLPIISKNTDEWLN